MKYTQVISTMLAGLAFSGLALADHHGGGEMHGTTTPSTFSKFDKNNDGRISRDEARIGADNMFNEIDTNKDGDGILSRTELEASHMKRLSRDFDKLDTNKDGKLTEDEMKMPMRDRALR